jgi:peroxiredoxin
MTLAIGDTAPDFEAQTTEGRIRFHDWIGDSWAVLFSHPKDFTPVCTTELGYMARIKPEFDRRGVKIIGLSVDSTGDHDRWAADIAETQGAAPNYPIIGDDDFNVTKLYGMLPASTSQPQGGHACELEARRGRDHRRLGQQRGRQKALRGLEGAQTVHPHRLPTELAASRPPRCARALPAPKQRWMPPARATSPPEQPAWRGRAGPTWS